PGECTPASLDPAARDSRQPPLRVLPALWPPPQGDRTGLESAERGARSRSRRDSARAPTTRRKRSAAGSPPQQGTLTHRRRRDRRLESASAVRADEYAG